MKRLKCVSIYVYFKVHFDVEIKPEYLKYSANIVLIKVSIKNTNSFPSKGNNYNSKDQNKPELY